MLTAFDRACPRGRLRVQLIGADRNWLRSAAINLNAPCHPRITLHCMRGGCPSGKPSPQLLAERRLPVTARNIVLFVCVHSLASLECEQGQQRSAGGGSGAVSTALRVVALHPYEARSVPGANSQNPPSDALSGDFRRRFDPNPGESDETPWPKLPGWQAASTLAGNDRDA